MVFIDKLKIKSRLKEISKLNINFIIHSNGMKISEWKNLICWNNFESHILTADVLIPYNGMECQMNNQT